MGNAQDHVRRSRGQAPCGEASGRCSWPRCTASSTRFSAASTMAATRSKRYAEVRYLIVDDWAKRRPTGFVLDSLFSLIDQRYSAMLPTLVTTQYKPSDLVRRLAEQGDP